MCVDVVDRVGLEPGLLERAAGGTDRTDPAGCGQRDVRGVRGRAVADEDVVPDVDLADAAWNSSGVPWHTIYYQANYQRLQRVKSRWDPRNVFRHGLSIQGEVL